MRNGTLVFTLAIAMVLSPAAFSSGAISNAFAQQEESEQSTEIEVEIEDGTTKIHIKMEDSERILILDSVNKSEILSEIQSITGMSESEIISTWEIEAEGKTDDTKENDNKESDDDKEDQSKLQTGVFTRKKLEIDAKADREKQSTEIKVKQEFAKKIAVPLTVNIPDPTQDDSKSHGMSFPRDKLKQEMDAFVKEVASASSLDRETIQNNLEIELRGSGSSSANTQQNNNGNSNDTRQQQKRQDDRVVVTEKELHADLGMESESSKKAKGNADPGLGESTVDHSIVAKAEVELELTIKSTDRSDMIDAIVEHTKLKSSELMVLTEHKAEFKGSMGQEFESKTEFEQQIKSDIAKRAQGFDLGGRNGGPNLQKICHTTAADANANFTITVGTAAAKFHLEHGDTLGPCNKDKQNEKQNQNQQQPGQQEQNDETDQQDNESEIMEQEQTDSSAQASQSATVNIAAGSSGSQNCSQDNSCYSPYEITIQQGATVTWHNKDSASHMILSGNVKGDTEASVGPAGELFESGLIEQGDSFEHTFDNTGTFEYFDSLHPWMSGQVVVTGSKTSESSKLSLPSWIKNNAKFWAKGDIGDSEFASGIEYMIKNDIVNIPNIGKQSSSGNQDQKPQQQQEGDSTQQQQQVKIPSWVKSNAELWSQGKIDDSTFASGIEYLVKVGVITLS